MHTGRSSLPWLLALRGSVAWLLAEPLPVLASLLSFGAAALDFSSARAALGWVFFLSGGLQAGLAVLTLSRASRRLYGAAESVSIAALVLWLVVAGSTALGPAALEAGAAALYLMLFATEWPGRVASDHVPRREHLAHRPGG
jgi:hypothetical protein